MDDRRRVGQGAGHAVDDEGRHRQVAHLAVVGEQRRAHQLLEAFGSRYANPNTQRAHRFYLGDLIERSGIGHPVDLTEAHVAQWATIGRNGQRRANNTTRSCLGFLRRWLEWCERNDELTLRDVTRILPPDTPLRAIPRTYGKVQGRHPARFLTADEAQRMLDACKDGTITGKRDYLAIRLGLHGVRSHEILKMTHGNLAGDTLTWTGKRNRVRTVILDSGTVAVIRRWAEHIQRVTGHPVTADTPLVVRLDGGGFQHTRVRVPVEPLRSGVALIDLVQRRADASGLGHVSPHDLRRTTAAILHNTRTDDGGHVFDLLDIQRVLGHADPAVTMRSYLEPLDTGVLRRAADRIGQLR